MEEELIIATSGDVTFETLKKKSYYSESEASKDANVFIIPEEHLRDGYDILFFENTKNLLRALNDHGDIKADVPCSEEDFKEIELHSGLLELGTFLVTSFIFPIFVNLVSSFIYDLIKKNDDDPKKVKARLKVNVDKKNGKSIKFEYKGPASTFNSSMKKIEEILEENDD